MDSRTGKAVRLGRILRPETGRAVVVAASHGVMVTPGMIPVVEKTFIGRDRPGFVLHLDWKNHARSIYTPGKDGRSEGVLAQLAHIEEVSACGIDAVMTYMYLGQKDTALEQAEIARNTRIVRECERHGIGVIIEPRSALEGVDPDALSAKVMSLYCRIAADIGADLVKALWPGSVEDFAAVTSTCYTPVLLAGGAGGEDPHSTLQLAADALRAGAKGVMFGRRIFRAQQPAGVLRALNAVVHEGQSVEQALQYLEQ